MKIHIEINGRVSEGNIPTSWTDPDAITFGQYMKLEECAGDHVKIFAMFLGLDEDIVRRAKIRGLDSILLALKFMEVQAPMDIPAEIMGYPVPKDLGLETLGQYMDLRTDVQNGKDRTNIQHLERYTTYVAMYACKPYDWQKAEAMAPNFLNAPAGEVLAIGHFTLMKVIGLSAPMAKSYPGRATRLKRFRRALKRWVRNTVIMARYYIWRLKPGKVEAP